MKDRLQNWDIYSDQPKILDKNTKKELRKGSLSSIVKLIAKNIVLFPFLFIKFLFLKNFTTKKRKRDIFFYGLCVNLDKGEIQKELVDELAVKSLQIRFFLDDMQHIDDYVKFAKSFGEDKEILITIIQNKEHIKNQKLLQDDIKIVFEKFKDITDEFMIGNAINRIKWSFVTIDEYLLFFQTIQDIKDRHFPHIKLIGSSVIDFEYHWTIGSLFHKYNIFYDKVSSLLYVDRRGSPNNTQYGMFDLSNKIKLLESIVQTSPKCHDEIYITETNWPISGRAPYAPTSEKESVSLQQYDKYMKQYFKISENSKLISKVFWHQLIAPGYGLVDDRDGQIIKQDPFYSFKDMINKAK
ncbi:MAG: hypothetical protein B1H07_04755 [Campylobacteraceae bacterium 4484_166]|nr:MAG: hypothetical protein B1H07_04755 [Campylobacteraceae bacterium 4484_166]